MATTKPGRLNRKSTKNAIIKVLINNEQLLTDSLNQDEYEAVERAVLNVAKELEISIKPEDYK